MMKGLLVLLTALALVGCGSGSSKSARSTRPTTDPRTACEDALRLQLSAPATAKFTSTKLLGKTTTGTTVTGMVDSKQTGGTAERDRWVCIDRVPRGPVALNEGPLPSAPEIANPLKLDAACIASGQLSTSTQTTPPDCPTVVTYGLAISADGQYKPLGDVLELLSVLCSPSHASGPTTPICKEAATLQPH